MTEKITIKRSELEKIIREQVAPSHAAIAKSSTDGMNMIEGLDLNEQVEPSVSESVDDVAAQYGFEPSGNGGTYMQVGYDGANGSRAYCVIDVQNSVHSQAPYNSVEGVGFISLKVASGLYNQSAFVRSYSSPRPQQVHKMFANAVEMNRLLNAG